MTKSVGGILSRYLFKEILVFLCINLLAFTGILLTIRILKFAGLIINKGVELSQVASVFIAIIPTFLELALPLSVLLGVMLAFSRLSGDSEIVVMRASGISFLQLLTPVILIGLLSTCIGFYLSHSLKPWGNRELSQSLFTIARTKSTAGLQQGVFNPLGKLTLYSETIDDKTGALSNVVVDDRRETGERKIVVAKKGQIISDAENKRILFKLVDGVIHESIDGKYGTTKFDSNFLTMNSEDFYDPGVTEKGRQPRDLSTLEIKEVYAELKLIRERLNRGENVKYDELSTLLKGYMGGQQINSKEVQKRIVKLRIENSLRYAMPVASLALAILAMPLGIHPPRVQRAWGAGLPTIFGMLVFVTYYAVLSVSITLSENGSVNPYVAIWIPNLLTLAVGVWMNYSLFKERWQSVPEAFFNFLDKIKSIFTKENRVMV